MYTVFKSMFFILCSCYMANSLASTILVSPPDGILDTNTKPFGTEIIGEIRYQQIYSSDLFSKTSYVNSISFFETAGYDYPTVYGNIVVTLSTTNVLVGELDLLNLDNNLGADISHFNSSSYDPIDLDIFTIEGAPFYYDPSIGNLLMEIFITKDQDQIMGGFDSSSNFGDLTSRANTFGNVGYGLVTEFDVTAVPLPATLWLFSSGLFFLFSMKRKTRALIRS